MWLYWPVGILAAIFTVLAVIGVAIDRAEKDMIHEAEVKHAKEKLEN